MQTPLTIDLLKEAARDYSVQLSLKGIPSLFGITDGKAVGTYVEAEFNEYISDTYSHEAGNAAKGIDFPALNVDLKVTSIKQPQSSGPFRNARQKVYGLGYHLLVMVYDKSDDHAAKTARLNILHVLFVEATHTADFQLTTGLQQIIHNDGNVEEIDAYLEDKNIPIDAENRMKLAIDILKTPPALGYLTISNALQWRLQYGRAIGVAKEGKVAGVTDLIGK